MEKYLTVDPASLEEMLAACKDYKERQNIRCALREIKGLKLDGNDVITYSFMSNRVKHILADTSPRNSQLPLKSGTINNESEPQSNIKNGTSNGGKALKSLRESSTKLNNKTDENGNVKPQYRSYLYAGTLSSPKHSPRRKKDPSSPRKTHTAITRIEVVDKSDLVDKCTETEEGAIDTNNHIENPLSKISSPKIVKLKTEERKERIKIYETTPLPKKQTKDTDSVIGLDLSAIEFSGDLDKVKQTSFLHRPVSVHLSSHTSDSATLSQVSSCLSSPRKPKKIVSYRTSAFSAANKLHPVSSTISRARLQSTPHTSDKSHEYSDKIDSQGISKQSSASSDTSKDIHRHFIDTGIISSEETKDSQESGKQVSEKTCEPESVSTDKSAKETVDTQENIYSAKPIEIKRETEAIKDNIVDRLRSKLNSKRNRDFKSDLEEFNFFTNKMKEKHGRNDAENTFKVVSPLKFEPEAQPGENELNSDILISNYTNNKIMTMAENVDTGFQKKKPGLSRKNRIDSDEQKHYRKYRKKNKDNEEKSDNKNLSVLKKDIVSPKAIKGPVTEMSPRRIVKGGSVRRKLPQIPVKQDSEPEDDETVHQRTIRLLQERRTERRKLAEVEKEAFEKVDKSKMSPADLKKSLERKLEKPDSKRKAYRVRRELQLLNRENELKSASGNKLDAENDDVDDHVGIIHCDKAGTEVSAILTPKSCVKSENENERKIVQRSKSDIVRRHRAVSETDILIDAPGDSVDGESEKYELKMFEIEEPLTPLGKIELIGTLMQEEAKLQEMLRKSSNFSEKRRMRAEVRHLRQKRMALEGPSDQQTETTLRRSASVTAGVVTYATPVYITPPVTASEKQSGEDVSQPSIEELRKKLSETQDYDEKKKIRLALRQLRQQNREGSQSSLQRSQSFIYQKSSEPITNGTTENVQTVHRSQSVTEFKRVQDSDNDSEYDSKQRKKDTRASVANGDISHHEKEKLKSSELSAVDRKPPVPKTLEKQKGSDDSKQKHTNLKSDLTVAQVRTGSVKQIKDTVNDKTDNKLKHSESDRSWIKSGSVDKSKYLTNGKFHDHLKTQSFKENEKFHKHRDKFLGGKKPVEFLKETVTKLESQKQKRIQEKCEIFEKNDRKDSGRGEKSGAKEITESTDKARSKTPQILVSRADVERSKQNKLVNLRRHRSNSAPPIHSNHSNKDTLYSDHSNTDTLEGHKQCLKQIADQRTSSSFNEVKNTLKSKVSNSYIKPEVKNSENRPCEPGKDLAAASEFDNRLSPSLLWLEEKRKCLPLSGDVEKLMSTMDIEAAFSEILGAVEEVKEQNEAQTTDIPIVEEDSCESSGIEDDEKTSSVNKNKMEIFESDTSSDNVNDDTSLNETTEVKDIKEDNVTEILKDGEGAIQQTSGNKKSEAKIQLSSNLSLDLSSRPDSNGAISVIHGEDGTVTVQEVSRVEEGDTTITEWKKLRRTQSKTETRETDTVVEKKITSPGGSSSVYEKDVSNTKHKLTSRGSNYFSRNHYNIKRKKDLDGTEVVEHDLSTVSENMSISKNESWGDKSEAKVVLNRDDADNLALKLKSIEGDGTQETEQTNGKSSQDLRDLSSHPLSIVQEHLGRPSGSPEVKVTLKEMSAVEGDTVTLECTIVSSPVPNVSWFRGDNLLTVADTGIKMDFDPELGKASLEIQQASVRDSGEYKCVFENPLGTASTKGMLLVKKKCLELPTIMTELADITVCEGHSLCLECQVSETNTVAWYKDGVIIRSNADFKQTFDGAKAKLEIAEIFLDDCGNYSCVVKNDYGEKRSSCKITVTESESPDIVFPVFLKKPETTIANEWDPVIIDCEAIGSPQPTVTWYCDGSKFIEDSRHRMSYDGRVAMLVVRRVRVADSGKIECVVENSSGKISADCHLVIKALKTAPVVEESLSDQTVASGEDARLRCVITGEPKPEVSWHKNGLIIGQMFDFKQTFNDGEATLVISKICAKDAGCYECIATNEKGEISTSCQLIVKERDEPVAREENLTAKITQPEVTVSKDTMQTAALKTLATTFVQKEDTEQKQVSKSQASKVMLVRQGSLRSLRQEKLEKPLVRTGSLQSIDLSQNSDDSSKSAEIVKSDSSENDEGYKLKQNGSTVKSQFINRLKDDIPDVSKVTVDVNKNYTANLNVNIPEPAKTSSDVDVYKNNTDKTDELKTVTAGSDLSSLCLESANVKEVKHVVKFRAGGEIRRSQSVRTPGTEKPEWLQVKLRKVGIKPSPLTLESEKLKTQSQDSSKIETVQNETPVCVQKEIKLSRSESAKVQDSSLALRDSTNSPSNQPNRGSLKLTPVSERAKIFQMRETNGSSSGKSSPVDIISKAINLSRTESLRSPVGNKSLVVQRSQSFKIDKPSASQGDVTLELTPQKSQEENKKSDSGSSGKGIKFWDPTAPSSTKMDYSKITDEEELTVLLTKSDNFEERKKIRARIKEVREQHMKEWEAKRVARQTEYEDPIKRKHREADLMKQQKLKQFEKQAAEHHESKHLDMAEKQLRERVKLADEEKKRTMKEYQERGATHQESLHLEISERALKEKIKQADILKKKTLDAYDQAAGKTDGKSVTTTRKVETVTKVGGATGKPAGRGSAMNAFKAMDAKNAPKTNLAAGAGRANITRSPSAIKTMLLEWCKAMTREYADIIEIQNFSTSWNNGLAFCALIHHFYPDAFDIRSLDPKERRKNFELAFDMAEKLADIAPLLDVEDMVRMQKPDWKCVFTYVQSFYRKLNSHERNKAMA